MERSCCILSNVVVVVVVIVVVVFTLNSICLSACRVCCLFGLAFFYLPTDGHLGSKLNVDACSTTPFLRTYFLSAYFNFEISSFIVFHFT